MLLLRGFTSIYHVEDASELNSRRKKPQERKTSGILHCSESDGWWIWYGGNSTRSDGTKDRAIPEYLDTPSKYSMLVQFEARSRGRLAILPERGNMQSFSTAHYLQLALRKRSVWRHKMSSTRWFAWHRECRVSYCNRTRNMVNKIHKTKTQDHLGNHQAIRKVTEELGNNTVDYRISGAHLSAFEQQDTTRENKVKHPIEKFDNHKHENTVKRRR